MLTNTKALLGMAERGGFAIGAFNVYNLEGALAVTGAAEEAASPAVLQIMAGSTGRGGRPLASMCLEAANSASVPMAVHLDHSTSRDEIERWLESGLKSVMADG
ncbi:MAG: class II fructose-bisphosphate aldolase, partial [SAR202 cluster bacterium]|nr:class II fructose-bisphosphate aldolase [SAR202 cluster bacterium]